MRWWAIAAAAGAAACGPATTPFELPLGAETRGAVLVALGSAKLAFAIEQEPGAGVQRGLPILLSDRGSGPVLFALLEYDVPLSDLGLAPGAVPDGTCRRLPPPRGARERVFGEEAEWAALSRARAGVDELRVACLSCPEGRHDGGRGICVAAGECAPGLKDGGDGACVERGCSPGYHDRGDGTCAAMGCATGYHDGGEGACVIVGACAPGYHDGGGGTCVRAGMCASGYGADAAGGCCVNPCGAGQHDGGDGMCRATGCARGFALSGACCVREDPTQTVCPDGQHGGGDGACVAIDACSPGYRDTGGRYCDLAARPCRAGYHDGGRGSCVLSDACDAGFAGDGTGACAALGTCARGFAPIGDGFCAAVETCGAGQHDGGGGTCVAAGACSAGFERDGTGTCYRYRAIGRVITNRAGFSATLISPTQLLLAGGYQDDETVEIFDVATGRSRLVPNMIYPRYWHSSAALAGGRVLISGGIPGKPGAPEDARVEIRDPRDDTWTELPDMAGPWSDSRAMWRFPDGRLYLAGDRTRSTVLDPLARKWHATAAPPMSCLYSSAVILPDGRFFAVTASSCPVPGLFYDPVGDRWTVWRELSTPVRDANAAVLPDGHVLLLRPSHPPSTERTREALIVDPATLTSRACAPMPEELPYPLATVLPDGRVLVTSPEVSHLLLDTVSCTWSTLRGAMMGRTHGTQTLLPDGRVILAGGKTITTFFPDVEAFESGRRAR